VPQVVVAGDDLAPERLFASWDPAAFRSSGHRLSASSAFCDPVDTQMIRTPTRPLNRDVMHPSHRHRGAPPGIARSTSWARGRRHVDRSSTTLSQMTTCS